MARGRKSYTPAEELDMIENQIKSMDEELKLLKNRKKEVEKIIMEQEMSELYSSIKQSGKSVKDIIGMLTPGE